MSFPNFQWMLFTIFDGLYGHFQKSKKPQKYDYNQFFI